MNAAALIRDAQSEGVNLSVSSDGKIELSGTRATREKWARVLKPHRGEIITLLSGADVFDREAFEERAAIMEFDGGLSREEAERLAALDVPGVALDVFSFWWRLEFQNGEQREIFVPSGDTRAEMLRRYPAALSAYPFMLEVVEPDAALTESEERAIRAWLASIGETDEATIAEVIEGCRNNRDQRDYFLARASKF